MTERRFDIDRLRVLAVLLLFPFHSAWIFTPFFPYVSHDPPILGFIAFLGFVHQWHMHLFFILAGMSTWYALRKRSPGQYLVERLRRLLVPLVFGTLVVVPPLVWCRLKGDPDYTQSYLEFYPDFFDGVAPHGNFEWSHLWFVAYLLTFSVLALPLFAWLGRGGAARLTDGLAALCQRKGGLLLLGLPLALIEAGFRPGWPGLQNLVDDWANFLLYLTYFVYGYLLCSHEGLTRAIERNWRLARVLAIIGMLSFFTIHGLEILPKGRPEYTPGYMAFQFFRGFNSWCWIVWLLGWGRVQLDFGSRLLDYAREAALPYYILHHTPLMLTALVVIDWSIPAVIKWAIIVTSAFVATAVVYDLLVRRWWPVRLLFGMRRRQA